MDEAQAVGNSSDESELHSRRAENCSKKAEDVQPNIESFSTFGSDLYNLSFLGFDIQFAPVYTDLIITAEHDQLQ